MRRSVWMSLAVMVAGASLHLAAQGQPLAHVRDLYSNAAYEDVLSAVAADASPSPQIGQYRVFSLIALGRPTDAEKAAEAMLAEHPDFHPDSDASPRLVDVFASARRKIAPEVLNSMYLSARKLLDAKDRDGAVKAFTQVVAVANDPDLKDDKTVAELGFLANGFLDLSRALPAGRAAAPVDATSSGKPEAAPNQASADPTARPAQPVIAPPRPIHEELPRWVPPPTLARAEYKGRIVVHVSADGKVESSEILDSVHPLYDPQLLRASKDWSYTPGLRNGTPVAADHIVEVVLKPR